MAELTTVARVKGALRIPAGATIHDVRLGEIVEEVESQILDDVYLDAFAATTYTERVDTWPGQGASFLVERFPLLSVVALTVSSEALVEGEQFLFKRHGKIQLIAEGAMTPYRRADVQVTYTAGLVAVAGTTPAVLTRWATLSAALQYNNERMAGIEQQTVRPVVTKMSRAQEDQVRAEIERIAARYLRPMG